MPHKKETTWVVIADGMRARILRWEGGTAFADAIDRDLSNPEVHGFARDLKSDAPGRGFVPGSEARHGMEPPTDPHALEKERFGRQVAAVLDEAAGRKAFDRLVLVAPPKALGTLRGALAERVRRCVAAELPKDLVKTPQHELAGHLKDVLGPGPRT